MAEKTSNAELESEEFKRRNFISKCISNLSSNGYSYVRHLGKGTFGDVLEFVDEDQKRFAFKLVDPKRATKGEINLWPQLHHANVQPLVELIIDRTIPAILFKMPVQLTSLEDVIENKNFYNNPNALQYLIQTLTEILDGLQYLQSNNIAHMDLKTNNVLISPEGHAMLCDFTFIGSAENPITDYGTPLHLRPPEACWSKGHSVPVNGFSFDAWTFGLLALDCMTRHVSWRELPNRPESWSRLTYPALFRVLEADNFERRVRWAYPGSDIPKEQITSMRNFVLMFLRHNPEERPTAAMAAQHQFLGRGSTYALEDKIWKTIEEPGDDPAGNVTETQSCMKTYSIQERSDPERISETQPTHLNISVHPNHEESKQNSDDGDSTGSVIEMQSRTQTLPVQNRADPDRIMETELVNLNTSVHPNHEESGHNFEFRYDVNNEKNILLPDKKKKRGFRGMVKWIRTKTRAFRLFK